MKSLPFGLLKSRISVATILSYFGYSDKVSDLMQGLSHKTRAYFVNAGKLKGFLTPYSVTGFLEEAHET